MTTRAQLKKAAIDLPEVEETTHFGMVSYAVRGKHFATVTKDGRSVMLHLPDAAAEAALTEHPSAERLIRMGTPVGLTVPLADIGGQALNGLVAKAWKTRAPKRLAARAAAAADGMVPAGSDLPRGMGKPATRALLTAGIDTLADAAKRSRGELVAMHGVGPKAVDMLADALGAEGMAFRAE